MKTLKYLLGAIVIVLLVTAVVVHLKREALAMKIANSILAGTDVRVASLSIRSIQTHGIVFSSLDLVLGNGTGFEMRDVDLPLSLPDTKLTAVTVGELVVVPATNDDEPLVFTEILDLVAGMPAELPGVTVNIARVEYPDLPTIEALYWYATSDGEQLALTIADVRVETELRLQSAKDFSIDARASVAHPGDIAVALEFQRSSPGYRVAGTVDIRLASWVGLLRDKDWLPEEVETLGGRLHGPVELRIETEELQQIAIAATLGAEDVALSLASDETGLESAGAGEYRLSLAYPSLEWTLETDAFAAAIDAGEIGLFSAEIAELRCRSGLSCNLTARARTDQLEYEGTGARNVEFAGKLHARIDDDWQVTLLPSAISAADIASADWSIASLKLKDSKALQLELDSNGTQASAESASFAVNTLKVGEDFVASAPLRLRKFLANSNASEVTAAFEIPADGSSMTWQQTGIVVPRIDGTFELRGETGTADIRLADGNGAFAASAQVAFTSSSISATLSEVRLDFGLAALSERLSNWPFPWDVVAGIASAGGSFSSDASRGEQGWQGNLILEFAGLAGNYNEIGATGINGSTPVRLAPSGAVSAGPADLRVALIDIGVPIEDLGAAVEWDGAAGIAEIDRLRFNVLGGTASATAFRYDVEQETADLTLDVKSVQLGLIAQLAEFDDIALSGSLSGQIPVSVAGTSVTITGGSLASEAPGGVIRYHAGADSTATSGLGVATRALSNMQYETLASKVNYTKDGDLVLNMRLKGINPDYDPLQPVILNLNVENNIPQLLRSLQATRDIEQIIESRSAK